MSSETEAPIRVMTVDDHPLMRDGIMAVLSGEPDIEVVAEASCGLETLERFAEVNPDVTLMDLKLPDIHGAEVITRLHRVRPEARFIILTTYQGDVQAARAFQAGASGYMLKGMMRTELAQTIRQVHAGRTRVPPEIAAGLIAGLGGQILSAREVEVVGLVAQGQSNKEIGLVLRVSEDTIKAHLKRIAQKLHAKDRAHVVAIALRRGYLID